MHHEREDGSGYPLAITGEKIHCFAKIIAIADELDVMNSDETYKNKRGPFEVLEIIKEKRRLSWQEKQRIILMILKNK